MKKTALILIFALLIVSISGCQFHYENCEIAATTKPVCEFTVALCEGTDLGVCLVVAESVSCLHDYTLQASQMQMIESADTVIISGGGLEDFLDDPLSGKGNIIDASENIDFLCSHHGHEAHEDHHHEENDPHIWLSPEHAKIMVANICEGLTAQYPEYADIFTENLNALTQKIQDLSDYADQTLSELSCRDLITFHDGFAYFANAFDLTILKAIEEESGSEASASELKELILMIRQNHLPAIFTEQNGSDASAKTIQAETDVKVFALDMGMSDRSYFEAMYYNIDTIKEALG